MDEQAIDEQFDRAVQIVQSLPKTGPIQTGYEEKLAMYSLYKQATVGNVKGSRPAMWDMLARAKWDAWAKHEHLTPAEAKWRYVDELMKVLRRYPDKTVAQDLVKELEAYETRPGVSMSQAMDSGSDTDSEAGHLRGSRPVSQSFQDVRKLSSLDSEEENSDSEIEQERGDRVSSGLHGPPASVQNHHMNQSLLGRPQSSLSTQRYRTPMGSLVMSPPPAPLPVNTAYPASASRTASEHLYHQPQQALYPQPQHPLQTQPQTIPAPLFVHPQSVNHIYQSPGHSTAIIPNIQPMPAYETPSAFPGPSPPPSSHITLPSASGLSASGMSSFTHVTNPYPSEIYNPIYNGSTHHSASPAGRLSGSGSGPAGMINSAKTPLERAVENVQAHLTALQERMDMIEGRVEGGSPYASGISLPGPSGTQRSPPNSPFSSYLGPGSRGARWPVKTGSFWTWLMNIDEEAFGWEHMGLWSAVLKPLVKTTKFLAMILAFLLARSSTNNDGRRGLSPSLAILRRLLLDVSFVLFALFVGRRIWKRSGVRRREVTHALKGVWRALLGSGTAVQRQLVDVGVQMAS